LLLEFTHIYHLLPLPLLAALLQSSTQSSIHAAFSRVLYLSGAADYFDKVEDTAEQNSFPMRANQTWGYFSLIGLRMSLE